MSSETHDTTTLGDDWKEFTAGLLGGDTVKHSLFYNNGNSTSGTYQFMNSRLGTSGTLKWGDGVRTTSVETIITQVSTPISVGDMIKLDVTHQLTGAVTVS